MKIHLIIFLIFLLFLTYCVPVLAQSGKEYISGATGYDISYPQCNNSYPDPAGLAVIGLNGGKAFTINKCLKTEWDWAKKSDKQSVYLNLNYPSGKTKLLGMLGPSGICKQTDLVCQAYNYGYNAADYAYHSAKIYSILPGIWWIDIETANTWSDDTKLNIEVLNGAIHFLASKSIQAGIYSTKRDWGIIMGKNLPTEYLYYPIKLQSVQIAVPLWIGGATSDDFQSRCSNPFDFLSNILLVQYSGEIFDIDYVCP